MEYATDKDFPNHYADRVIVGLCDMHNNTFSSSKSNNN